MILIDIEDLISLLNDYIKKGITEIDQYELDDLAESCSGKFEEE